MGLRGAGHGPLLGKVGGPGTPARLSSIHSLFVFDFFSFSPTPLLQMSYIYISIYILYIYTYIYIYIWSHGAPYFTQKGPMGPPIIKIY